MGRLSVFPPGHATSGIASALMTALAVSALGCSDDTTGQTPSMASGNNAGVENSGGGTGGLAPGSGGTPATADVPPRLLRYVTSASDRALRVQIDAVEGHAPFPSSVDRIRDEFSALLEKPDGLVFDVRETLQASGEQHEWTFGALDAYARERASDDTEGPITLVVLALDGRYVDEDSSGTVLGLAWDQRFVALFQDAIRAPCDGAGVLAPLSRETCEVAERNVWVHEVGHVIGLVDNGLPMLEDHRDPEHGRHDSAEDCVMYWAYDGPQLFDTLLTRLSAGQSADLDFCDRCRADVAAVQ